MRTLLDGLRTLGFEIDEVHDLAGMRAAFFRSGGHRTLLLGPGLSPALAARASADLLAIDPELRVLAFGEHPRGTLPAAVARLQAHHPATRGALAAVLRWF